MNIEAQKKRFANHVATLNDYGPIKVIDFKRPDSNVYRIRFIFEDDYCRLHISGDLGELIATNYNNMTFEKFSRDFVNNPDYFSSKIDCHSRRLVTYDEEDAKEDLIDLFRECDCYNDITSNGEDEDNLDSVLDDILDDYSDLYGMGSKGIEVLGDYICDAWEYASDIGERKTDILELYMLAFKLASEQLNNQEATGLLPGLWEE